MNCPVCCMRLSLTERFGNYCPRCGVNWIEKEKFDDVNDRIFIEITTRSILWKNNFHYGRKDDKGSGKPYKDRYVKYRRKRGFVH